MRPFRIMLTLVVVAFMAAAVPIHAAPTVPWPTHGWPTSTPEVQGIDSAGLAQFLDTMTSAGSPDPFHTLLVIRHGYVVLDASPYPFDSSKQQAFSDAAEPVLDTLIGIAIDKGYLKGVDQSIWDFLPKDKTANMDANKAALTIDHFLTHSSGLQFADHEDYEKYYPLGANDPPWLQLFLDAKMVSKPGVRQAYFYGDGLVLSAILQKATGMTALDFAKQNLFGPLGITDVTWLADPQGITIGEDEIYLSPLDMAKIAYLYLHNGQWEGKQIVSEGFVKKATSKIVNSPPSWGPLIAGFGYGWIVTGTGQDQYFLSITPGGEHYGVLPGLDVIYMATGDSNATLLNQLSTSLKPAIKASSALPENPDALARLNAKVQALAHPAPRDVPAVPAAFKAVAGKTFKLDERFAGWKTLSFDFGAPGSKEGTLTLGINNSTVKLTVGQDFVYRVTPVGLPAQPRSEAYRLLGSVPWMARLSWSRNGSKLNIWLGDLMGRENWWVALSVPAENRLEATVVMHGLLHPHTWNFSGIAS